MTRQNEQAAEDRAARFQKLLRKSIDGGLESAVTRAGGQLLGVSFKLGEWEVLMVLKADFPGGPQVGFIGASSIGECFVKGMMEAAADKVRWREDKWRVNGG
jgi:hypothetical protein